MSSPLDDALPDWSSSGSEGEGTVYDSLPGLAAGFVRLTQHERTAEIKNYSRRYCFPHMDLARASGLYLFLRLIFDLPTELPRAQAKVFGGWLHPSVDETLPTFDLSWPVSRAPGAERFDIHPFMGYFGKGYDAEGEYEYFAVRFPLRASELLDRAEVGPAV